MLILKPFSIADWAAGARVVCRNQAIEIIKVEIDFERMQRYPVWATVVEKSGPHSYSFTEEGIFYIGETHEVDLFVEVQVEEDACAAETV